MRRSIVTRLAALTVGLVLLNTGCSFLFVNTPPPADETVRRPWAVSCTSSKAAPLVDTVVTGLEVARIALAANADDSTYQGSNQPLSRGADIGLGVAFGALFLSSAIYGYVETSRCSELERHSEEQSERTDAVPNASPSPSANRSVPAPEPSAPAAAGAGGAPDPTP